MTKELLALAEWLAERQITHVAMESAGGFWKPVYNLLEGMDGLTGFCLLKPRYYAKPAPLVVDYR